jgi:hypothetical protein
MARITVPPSKLAEIALSAMAQANVKADDETLAMVTGARRFLRAIMDETLIVVENPGFQGETPDASEPDSLPPALRAAPDAQAAPIRGGEGVVPESVTGAPRRRRR